MNETVKVPCGPYIGEFRPVYRPGAGPWERKLADETWQQMAPGEIHYVLSALLASQAENEPLKGTLDARAAGQIEAEKIIDEQLREIEGLQDEINSLRDQIDLTGMGTI